MNKYTFLNYNVHCKHNRRIRLPSNQEILRVKDTVEQSVALKQNLQQSEHLPLGPNHPYQGGSQLPGQSATSRGVSLIISDEYHRPDLKFAIRALPLGNRLVSLEKFFGPPNPKVFQHLAIPFPEGKTG